MDSTQAVSTTTSLILGDLFYPSDITSLTIFYLAWIAVFVMINIAWDIFSHRTPPFHISHLRDKISVLHSAAAFSSSLLIIISLINPAVEKLVKDTTVPLMLAALAGMLMTLPALCPYSSARHNGDQVAGG
jgi:hypothetical protein